MAQRCGVLFDVDGTLVDTNYLHVYAWWQAFRDAGHHVAMNDIHRCVGMGSDRLVEHLLGGEDETARNGHATHWARFRTLAQPFHRAGDLLRACDALGLQVVLASSADADDIEPLTAAIGADEAVSCVTSSDDAGSSKPSPDILLAALDKSGLAAEKALLVGDTVWDVYAARDAGMPCVAVLTGGVCARELDEAGAIAVYGSVAELLGSLEASPLGQLARGDLPRHRPD